MSVSYSTSLGYGYAFPSDECPLGLKGKEPYEDGDIPGWLEEHGLDLIGYDYCGDWMGGPNVYFFYLKGTEILHMDAREYSTGELIYSFDTPPLTMEQVTQLNKLGKVLGMEWPWRPSWKLIQNVS